MKFQPKAVVKLYKPTAKSARQSMVYKHLKSSQWTHLVLPAASGDPGWQVQETITSSMAAGSVVSVRWFHSSLTS